MSAPSVKYSRVAHSDSETTIFDYSSPFTYASTDPTKYKSIFDYKTSLKANEYDVQRNRGLEQKSIAVKLLYWSVVAIFTILIVISFPVSAWFVVKKIKADEQVIVSRLGIIKCIKGPALTMVIPCVDKKTVYSTSLREFNIPPQKVMTSDGLLVELGGKLRYHIIDAEKACFAAQDISHTMRVTAQAVTSKYIHCVKEKDLTDTASIHGINNELKDQLQKTFLTWGIAINSFEMTGLKAIMRVEQQDAIGDVIEPLKQWFFGGHEAGSPMSQAGDSPMAQIANMFASMTPAQLPTAPVDTQVQKSTPQAPTLASLSHTLTPDDLLKAVKTISCRQLVEQVQAVYKFVVQDGDSAKVYYMDLKHGEGDCGPGEPPVGTPDTTITISLADMQRMFTGSLQPFDAYMSGALQISGDISGAMKLDQLVKTIASVSTVADEQS